MKTLFIILVFLTLSFAGISNNAYQKAMGQSIEKLFQSKSIPEYIEVANQFERISQIEKNEWLPLYYATFANIMITFIETDNAKKDAYLDQGQKYLDKAMAIESNESELYALQGFIYSSRINVDPIMRGIIYVGKMKAALDKALELDTDNPRVYFLRAQMTLHMPKFVGGGVARALPFFQKAEEKYRIFKPKTEFSPNWGKEVNAVELKKVQKQAKA